MKQVSFLLNSLAVGGSEKKIMALANALSRKGYGCHVLYMNSPSTLYSMTDGISVEFLDRRSKIDLRLLRRYRRYLLHNNITTSFTADIYPSFIHGLAFLGLRRYVRQNVLINTYTSISSKHKRDLTISKQFFRGASCIFGAERQQHFWAATYGFTCPDSSVVYNGVNADYYNPRLFVAEREAFRQRLGILPADIVLGVVARLNPEKAIDHLIRAGYIARAKGMAIKIVIVGNGPERSTLMQVVSDLDMNDCVTFLGNQHDVRPSLSAMDIFVLPSVAIETFSNAALEAMSMARLVILSDIGGAREMISHGEDGFIVQPGDVDQLAQVIENAIDIELIRKLGRQARETVLRRFDFDDMVSRYASFII